MHTFLDEPDGSNGDGSGLTTELPHEQVSPAETSKKSYELQKLAQYSTVMSDSSEVVEATVMGLEELPSKRPWFT